MARVAVFDLDGVILKSPTRETNPDVNFWIDYWDNPDIHVSNSDVLQIINALMISNIHIFILTARPTDVALHTMTSLRNVCGIVPSVCHNIYSYHFGMTAGYHLMMRDNALFHDWVGNGQWKKEVIEVIKINHDVLFMMEDYKPNAEEIRKTVPVLLYEQKRSSSGD